MAKKLSPFEQAFADARKEYLAGTGPKNFTFNGKLYNTNLAGESPKKAEDIQSSTDALPSMSRQSGPVTITQGATYPKEELPKPKARSLVDQGRDVDIYRDVDKEAVLNAGLGLASLYPGTIAARTAYGVARPLVGAAVKYMTKKDSPISKDVEPELFTPGMKRPDNLFGEASARDFKKGGRISLDACKVSTHKPAKKNPNF